MNGLKADYSKKMAFHVVQHNAAGAADRIKKYGLDVHGMVITDQDDKIVWSESGHNQTEPGVRAAIEKSLSN